MLLGSVRIRGTLVSGASDSVRIPVTIPADLPAGPYHLIAAAGPPGQLVEFAAQRRVLTIPQTAGAVVLGDGPAIQPRKARPDDAWLEGGVLLL